MFELSIALKYLTPRKRQLSVSIISLISVGVIALVVWLVVVFFSVTHGLEKSWIQKLIALTAPIRMTPTEAYYRSYYYQIDHLSAGSHYSPKTIREKLLSSTANPYDENQDGELPEGFPKPLLNQEGELKDIIKETFTIAQSLPSIPGLTVKEFEMSAANLHLQLARSQRSEEQHSFLSQTAYLGSFDSDNSSLIQAILPIGKEEIQQFLRVTSSVVDPRTSLNLIVGNGYSLKTLPSHTALGEGILLPKSFQKGGVLIGDRGHLSYYAPTMSAVQEQRLPIYVAGFYDPGILPIGGKFLLVNGELVSLIHSSHGTEDHSLSNGINIRFDNIQDAEKIKKSLENSLKAAGIDSYWNIETYKEFDFTRDLIQQLSSERNLWTLLATVIILVACSNIISMLIILVNDKKIEIGILRAMGATSKSIAAIFGLCGMIMGMVGSLIGMLFAFFTLKNLQLLVDFIGQIQGYEMFNPIFYGNALPNEISVEALIFVIMTTSAVSLIAGIVPAIKAALLKPAAILKAE